MKTKAFFLALVVLSSCTATTSNRKPIIGTWKLVSGTLISKSDTTITDYTKSQSFIKVINDTHFAFMLHDLNHGTDSTKVFASGGGRYTLDGNKYTEHLEYCSDRQWEGNDFSFTITIRNDSLIQVGREEVESANVNQLNIERYVRVSTGS
jgi:hypothetical protein